MLDDVPIQIRQPNARRRRAECFDDVPFAFKRARQVFSTCPVLVEAFACERHEGNLTKKARGELVLKDLSAQAWKPMQKALGKEWAVWCKYGAVDVVLPSAAAKVHASKVLDSRAVWTDKGSDGDFQPKCRIVGRGFQEKYDEKLRRDSPTTSVQMANMIACVAATFKLSLIVADVTGAFLQGKNITRELYFRLPRNLGQCRMPFGIPVGSLLRLNKSIYGTNDASRAWYLAIRDMLLKQDWKPLSFEPASFVRRNTSGKLIGLMCLHVDDFLMAVDEKDSEGKLLTRRLAGAVDLGSLKNCGKEAVSFCGREYRQSADFSVVVTMDKYLQTMSPTRVARSRAKQPSAKLCPVEHNEFRRVLGQLQWACRMMVFEESFETSRLASSLASPTVADLMAANAAVRRVRSGPALRLQFSTGMKPDDLAIVCVTDSAFDNLPGHKSQRGHFLLIGDGAIIRDHSRRHRVHAIAWQSSRIARVVRSTLAAEAYSCSDAVETLEWTRSVLQEIVCAFSPTQAVRQQVIPTAAVTDCKSL